MLTFTVEIQNEQEKRVLLAFLHSLNYQYKIYNDDSVLTDIEVQEMARRKADFLAGKITSRPWNEIKKRH